MYGFKEEVTRDFILSKLNEYEIFYKYLGIYPDLKSFFCNPLRVDEEAGCRFYIDSRGVLKFNDLARRDNIDCFNVVQKIYNCTYYEALEKIANDFNLFKNSLEENNIIFNIENQKALEKIKKTTSIRIKRGELTAKDLKWWESNGWFKEQIEKFKLFLVTDAWLNDSQIYKYNPKDPCYAYHFGEYNYKLYFPLRDKFRFFHNNSSILQGLDQLPKTGDVLIITKSYKDVGCMQGFGINAVAPMSETILVNKDVMGDLMNRFFHIFTLFDRDKTGMLMSLKMKREYGTIPLLFDSKNKLIRKKGECKDFTEFYIKNGTNYILDLIEEVKSEFNL